MTEITISGRDDDPDKDKARTEHERKMAERGETVDIQYDDSSTGKSYRQAPKSGEDDAGDEGGGDKTKRPDHIPEKFWDAEKGEVRLDALLKAQQDAERELSRLRNSKGKPAGETDDNSKGGSDGNDDPATPQEAIAAARAEFAENGELSEDTYATLEKAGLSRDIVDGYIAHARSQIESIRNAAFEVAGGESEYRKMQEWAAENLEEADIAALNALLNHSDPEVVRRGAQQLKERYDREADRDPTVTVRGERASVTGEYFRSRHEMTTAMRDKRYQTDEAYRREVAQKIARAVKAGVDLYR